MLQTEGMPIAHSAGASTSGVKSGDDTRWKIAVDLLERAITSAEKSHCLQQIAEIVDELEGEDAEQLCEQLCSSGAIARICDMLDHDEREIHLLAIALVGNMASTAVDTNAMRTKEIFKHHQAFEKLLPHMYSRDRTTLYYTCGAVQNLCTDYAHVRMIEEKGVDRRLRELLQSNDEELIAFSRGCLDNMQQAWVAESARLNLLVQRWVLRMQALARGRRARRHFRVLLLSATKIQAAQRGMRARLASVSSRQMAIAADGMDEATTATISQTGAAIRMQSVERGRRARRNKGMQSKPKNKDGEIHTRDAPRKTLPSAPNEPAGDDMASDEMSSGIGAAAQTEVKGNAKRKVKNQGEAATNAVNEVAEAQAAGKDATRKAAATPPTATATSKVNSLNSKVIRLSSASTQLSIASLNALHSFSPNDATRMIRLAVAEECTKHAIANAILQTQAAKCLQSMDRGSHVRNEHKMASNAAAKLQAVERGRQARANYNDAQKATAKIQALERGRRARKNTQALLQEAARRTASKLQAISRLLERRIGSSIDIFTTGSPKAVEKLFAARELDQQTSATKDTERPKAVEKMFAARELDQKATARIQPGPAFFAGGDTTSQRMQLRRALSKSSLPCRFTSPTKTSESKWSVPSASSPNRITSRAALMDALERAARAVERAENAEAEAIAMAYESLAVAQSRVEEAEYAVQMAEKRAEKAEGIASKLSQRLHAASQDVVKARTPSRHPHSGLQRSMSAAQHYGRARHPNLEARLHNHAQVHVQEHPTQRQLSLDEFVAQG